jgi:signal transduction histidine kinase
MRRRLILSTALIALAAVVVLGVPLGAVEAARLRQDADSRLEREADAVAGAVDDRVERRQPVPPSLLRRYARPRHRIVVVPRRGPAIVTRPPIAGEVLRAHAGTSGVVRVSAEASVSELDARVHRAWLLIAALSAGGVLLAVALAAVQARRLARPLETIAQRSAQLGEGDFSVRVGTVGVPEIDAIAQALDTSAGRIAELVAREREFSANVSHQLRTPLTALRLRIEEAGDLDDRATRAREIDAALGETDRLEATIAELLAHARSADGDGAATVDLAAIVADHYATWRRVFQRAGRDLRVAAPDGIAARAARGTVGQVLDVLLDNALRHGTGTVGIDVTANGRSAAVTVSDAGPGIPDELSDQIFERGDSSTGGTGIGLHLARALAQADNGGLSALAGAPTRFELRLPRLAS